MVGLAILGTLPTVACALVGLLYQILRMDITGSAGWVIIVGSMAATIVVAAIVWRHPEGIAHRDNLD
ncbi:MAG: hypothetical protein FJ033_03910 [Chloroflexi bacterium]|nr:hypothetical protein [Chloroflexota bacterium]